MNEVIIRAKEMIYNCLREIFHKRCLLDFVELILQCLIILIEKRNCWKMDGKRMNDQRWMTSLERCTGYMDFSINYTLRWRKKSYNSTILDKVRRED